MLLTYFLILKFNSMKKIIALIIIYQIAISFNETNCQENSEELSLSKSLEEIGSKNGSTDGLSDVTKKSLLDNTPSTGRSISFDSKNVEYANTNLWSYEDTYKVSAKNQPWIDKVIRCIKIYLLNI